METQCCQAEMLASESQAAGAPCDFAAGPITVLSHCLSFPPPPLVFIDAPQVTDRPCCRTSDRSFSCLLAGLTSKLTTVSRLFIISKTMDRQTQGETQGPLTDWPVSRPSLRQSVRPAPPSSRHSCCGTKSGGAMINPCLPLLKFHP